MNMIVKCATSNFRVFLQPNITNFPLILFLERKTLNLKSFTIPSRIFGGGVKSHILSSSPQARVQTCCVLQSDRTLRSVDLGIFGPRLGNAFYPNQLSQLL